MVCWFIVATGEVQGDEEGGSGILTTIANRPKRQFANRNRKTKKRLDWELFMTWHIGYICTDKTNCTLGIPLAINMLED